MKTRELIYLAAIAMLCVLLYKSACTGHNDAETKPAPVVLKNDAVPVTHTPVAAPAGTHAEIRYIPYKVFVRDTVRTPGDTIAIMQPVNIDQPLDTLAQHHFTKTLTDANISITGKGLVTGRVDQLEFQYTITPTKPARHLYGLLEISNTVKLDNFNTKASLQYIDAKATIWSAGADTGKNLYVGIGKKIF
jgi:hypothetical protein